MANRKQKLDIDKQKAKSKEKKAAENLAKAGGSAPNMEYIPRRRSKKKGE